MPTPNFPDLRDRATRAIESAPDPDALRAVRGQFLGREKGELTAILKSLGGLSPDEKKSIAPAANALRAELEVAFTDAEKKFAGAGGEIFDPTEPTPADLPRLRGGIDPIGQIVRETEKYFEKLGFLVADGPELVTDFEQFVSLNFPPDHPARDMQDTFYAEDGRIPRAQTSAGQVAALKKFGAPLRMIEAGRVFRNENQDARHEHTFDQIEGMHVDRGISLGNLKTALAGLFRHLLGEKTEIRFRPGYFPFVEPGIEYDATCPACDGPDPRCRVCKGTGWLEIGGAGMVHPNVLRAGGVDPEEFSGWAFGFGPGRLAMIRWGIDDARLFRSADARFLGQF